MYIHSFEWFIKTCLAIEILMVRHRSASSGSFMMNHPSISCAGGSLIMGGASLFPTQRDSFHPMSTSKSNHVPALSVFERLRERQREKKAGTCSLHTFVKGSHHAMLRSSSAYLSKYIANSYKRLYPVLLPTHSSRR